MKCRYKGKIKDIQKIIVSDPSYDKDFSCRYENNKVNGKNWNVEIAFDEIKDSFMVKDLDGKSREVDASRKEIFILLQDTNQNCQILDNGNLKYYKDNKLKSYEIGVDTSCFCIGINDKADMIKRQKDEWHPDGSIKTLTDGFIGEVKEGTYYGHTTFIYMTMTITNDTGYCVNDLLNIFCEQLHIEKLQNVNEQVVEGNYEEIEEEL